MVAADRGRTPGSPRRRLVGVLPELAHYFPGVVERLDDMPEFEIAAYVARLRDLPPIGVLRLIVKEG